MKWTELRNKNESEIKEWLFNVQDELTPAKIVTALVVAFDRIEDLLAEVESLKRANEPPSRYNP